MKNTTAESWEPVGWISSPNNRGTIDILWACGVTILLCTWTVLCVNVSPPNATAWYLVRRKIWLALICWLGPEFLLYLSVQQWHSAQRSKKDFQDLKFTGWTLKHGFFADMGGFLLKTPNCTPFPLISRHLHYLIVEGYISRDQVEKEIILDEIIIDDKNKTDGAIRVITMAQTLWFVINCIARAIQKLAITTMELTVCSFITTTLAVTYFWWYKPADIQRAFVIEIDVTVEEIRARAGKFQTEEWHRTPLSFLDPEETWLSLGWTYFVNITRHMLVLQLLPVPHYKEKLRESIPDDHFADLDHDWTLWLQAFVTAACFAVNISAWNFWFPSTTERTLWRVASIIMATAVYWGAFVNMYIVPKLTQLGLFRWIDSTFTERVDKVWKGRAKFAAALRNNHPDKDPAYTVPLRIIVPGIFIAASYCLARAYLLAEDVVILRSQPPSTYETVNWSSFFPHA